MAPDDDRTQRVPLGPVGQYVRVNLARIRGSQGLNYKDVSDRLSQIGRPIPTLGLSRIEKGNRRVDADDLAALAIVLEVSPGQLLLPPDVGGDRDDEVELTPKVELSGYAARQWMAGHEALPAHEAITWPRPAFHYRIREREIEDMKQRLELLESIIKRRDAEAGRCSGEK